MQPKEFCQACKNCSLSKLCVPVGLNDQEMQRVNDIIQKQKVLEKGELLFRSEEKFSSLYAVHSGSFKAYKTEANGK